ncbi:MAG: hypothetical protein JWN38_912 [Candidatus Saccharibacteria bacterium]|nr:hypothetical protein [Candidatus Saccharibacteria bacterium]
MDTNNQTPPANATPPAEPEDDENSLEGPDLESQPDKTTSASEAPATPPPKRGGGGIKGLLKKFNLYLIIFLFILTVGAGLVIISYFQAQKKSVKTTITSTTLNQAALDSLASSDASVGDAKQTLSVQSNAVFAGQILVRGAAEIAGSLQVAGDTTLSALNVSGAASADSLQANKNLSVGGDSNLQGALTVQKSLQVSGAGSFGGALTATQISVNSLQLNGDLTLTNHIVAGGPTPSKANGPALGSGGTASNSGSDTGGTLAVNIGTGPAAGCFATINFSKKYNNTPRVLITPVGSDAGAIDYYVTRTTASFSICDATPPPAGANVAFDYFVFE